MEQNNDMGTVILYQEDFRKFPDWVATCEALGVTPDCDKVVVVYTSAIAVEEDE